MSAHAPLTYLFVPGNRPDRFAKALASGADRIIVDLEDAVPPADKAMARQAIAQWLGGADAVPDRLLVRINDETTPWHVQDLALLRRVLATGVMLPKCESPLQVAQVMQGLPANATVLPLIETARGMVALNQIATAKGVARLGFGTLDYMVDLDLPAGSPALDIAAAQIAIASRAAGILSPVAGVTPELDSARVSADMAQAKALGFGAKMCIHPSQLAAVRGALAPDATELAWAQNVLHAWAVSSGAAIQLNGKMVDRPVALKAERIVARAAQTR